MQRGLEAVPCNLCGERQTRELHGIARLARCVRCGLIYVNPRPNGEAIAGQYGTEYFHCPQPVHGGYEDYESDREEILATFRRRLRLIRPLLPAARPRLLDVGCATGMFLEVAREEGWSARGLDISDYALGRARSKGFAVERGTLPGATLPEGAFDLLTLWDVIEHVPDPSATLAACHRLLAPGGLLVMSTPDAGSLPARVLGSRWLGFRCLDEHLYFFTRPHMTRLLAKAGFSVRGYHAVGKVLSLPRFVARLRYYSRIAALLLGGLDRLVPRRSFYVNPLDTFCVLASRPAEVAVRRRTPAEGWAEAAPGLEPVPSGA